MASNQQGSSGVKKKNKEIKKRAWSSAEEHVLLAALKILVANGMKSDNGFKAGYMHQLEAAMTKAFPLTDIRGRPHIESKLSAWKMTYAALRDILARSGVGFNLHGDNKIDCDDTLWEEICRSDPSHLNWRNKPWPYLEVWKEVFGKDRATDESAAEFMEMLNDLMQSDEPPSLPHIRRSTHDSPINLESDDPPPVPANACEDSIGQSTFESAKSQKNNKKRQFEDSISSLVDLVGDIHKTNQAKYEMFTSTFGKQAGLNKSRGEVWSMLQNIAGLSVADMFVVGEKLLKMPECLDLFLGMTEEARPAYIERIKEI